MRSCAGSVSIAGPRAGAELVTGPVVRADSRRSVRLTDERISIQMLTTDGHHAMMPVINVYDEGGGMADPTRHDGEEFVHVIDGRVELTVGSGDPIVLEAGDSAYYRSDVSHSFRNAGPGVAGSSASPHRPTSRGGAS